MHVKSKTIALHLCPERKLLHLGLVDSHNYTKVSHSKINSVCALQKL